MTTSPSSRCPPRSRARAAPPGEPPMSTLPADSPTRDGPPAAALPLPPSPGRYQFEEEIARGGMGVVLRGRDALLNRPLAFKVLLDDARARPDLARRFLDEAKITAQLQHPNIVPVHEVGELADGRPFLAMKLIEGRTLAEYLEVRSDPAHDRPRWLAVFQKVCEALAYAHERGVIHRDLKPANVMVGAFGEVQVMDWGLAKTLTPAADADPAATTAP